jgi:hypothetical protein
MVDPAKWLNRDGEYPPQRDRPATVLNLAELRLRRAGVRRDAYGPNPQAVPAEADADMENALRLHTLTAHGLSERGIELSIADWHTPALIVPV